MVSYNMDLRKICTPGPPLDYICVSFFVSSSIRVCSFVLNLVKGPFHWKNTIKLLN